MISVRFEDFWPGFQPHDFLLPLFEEALGQPIEVEQRLFASVDIRVRSVFTPRAKRFTERLIRKGSRILERKPKQLHGPGRLNIWFTGENVRPPVSGFDLTFSYDVDDYGGSNVYLPLAVTRLDWWTMDRDGAEARRTGIKANPSLVHKQRSSVTSSRPKFACAFLSNPEPTRMRAITMLSEIGQVDAFGPAFGRPIPSKAGVAENYRHFICFENDLFPGYITEKVVDAWLLQCVPLWWGLDKARLLNEAAIVNASDFTDLASFVEAVARLDEDADRIDSIASAPLFAQPATLVPATNAIRETWTRVSEVSLG